MIVKKTYKELDEMIRCLDLHSRIYLGQYDTMLEYIVGYVCASHRDGDLAELMRKLRAVFIPDLAKDYMGASLGIWSDKTPVVAKKSYEIQQCLRYQQAYHRSNGEKGWGVCFDSPYINTNWNMNKTDVDRFHAILKSHRLYYEYQEGYVVTRPWCCPVLITAFHDDYVEIEMTAQVKVILDTAKDVRGLVLGNKLKEVFGILYPDIDASQYEELVQKLELKLAKVMKDDD